MTDFAECRHGEEGAASDPGLCSACSHERHVSDLTRARMALGVALLDDAWLTAAPARTYCNGTLLAAVFCDPNGRPVGLLVRLP